MRSLQIALGLLTLGCTFALGRAAPQEKDQGQSPLLTPDAPEMKQRAPDLFNVRLKTTKGALVLEVHRDWSPHGVDRFYNLVRHGYYDQSKIFRISKGNWAQFGINGDPKISTAWRERTIPDDPRKQSNVRGTVAFAFAVPNGRTTQVFVNLRSTCATTPRRTTASRSYPSRASSRVWSTLTSGTPSTPSRPAASAGASRIRSSRKVTPTSSATTRSSTLSPAPRLSSPRRSNCL
jgi:cyclophilin family peptidyl-prolyl cis-trans isomerase